MQNINKNNFMQYYAAECLLEQNNLTLYYLSLTIHTGDKPYLTKCAHRLLFRLGIYNKKKSRFGIIVVNEKYGIVSFFNHLKFR